MMFNAFKENIQNVCSVLPQIHTAFEFNNSIDPELRSDQDYYGRSLIMAFAASLGQARLNYGPDVSGILPKPITLHFVNTNGKKFHFSVFQLNNLNLEADNDSVKNIFWHEPSFLNMFEKCDYINASWITNSDAKKPNGNKSSSTRTQKIPDPCSNISFMACQGPTPVTCHYHLQMIHEQRADIVVMLTRLVETAGQGIF